MSKRKRKVARRRSLLFEAFLVSAAAVSIVAIATALGMLVRSYR